MESVCYGQAYGIIVASGSVNQPRGAWTKHRPGPLQGHRLTIRQPMHWIPALLVIGLLAGVPHAAVAAEVSCSAKSGEYTTALLELYTSEGCSSCPPADEWLTTLPKQQSVPEK